MDQLRRHAHTFPPPAPKPSLLTLNTGGETLRQAPSPELLCPSILRHHPSPRLSLRNQSTATSSTACSFAFAAALNPSDLSGSALPTRRKTSHLTGSLLLPRSISPGREESRKAAAPCLKDEEIYSGRHSALSTFYELWNPVS